MQIVFRFDAGPRVGQGHLMRSMVLARTMRNRGHQVRLLTNELQDGLDCHLDNFQVFCVPDGASGLDQLRNLHDHRPVDWLVIDHYGIGRSWEQEARRFAGRLMVIDDLADRPHDCDLLIDQNIFNRLQRRYSPLLPLSCQSAFGLDYLLARPEFYANRRRSVEGTLIFLGGGNHGTALKDLLDVVCEVKDEGTIQVVATHSYDGLDAIRARLGAHDGLHVGLTDPSDLYGSVARAVVRCGFIAYELALLGVPMVIIHGSQIQTEVAMALQASGHGIPLAERDTGDARSVRLALERASKLRPLALNQRLRPGSEVTADLLEEIYGR